MHDLRSLSDGLHTSHIHVGGLAEIHSHAHSLALILPNVLLQLSISQSRASFCSALAIVGWRCDTVEHAWVDQWSVRCTGMYCKLIHCITSINYYSTKRHPIRNLSDIIMLFSTGIISHKKSHYIANGLDMHPEPTSLFSSSPVEPDFIFSTIDTGVSSFVCYSYLSCLRLPAEEQIT